MEREILKEIVGNVSLARVQELQAQLREKEAEIERLQEEIRLITAPEESTGGAWAAIQSKLAASQREVERLKKDPLCQALTDHDCCCHSCLKDEAIAQMLKTERERDLIQAENAEIQQENERLKNAREVRDRHIDSLKEQLADQRTLLRELAKALKGFMHHGCTEGYYDEARAALDRAEEGMK